MWIKICGNTNLEDALFAAEAGADALGFIFAQSPRQVSVDAVRPIVGKLPPEIETYGVFVDSSFDEIVAAVTYSGLTGVQIHRSSDPLLSSRLRQYFASHAKRVKIVRAMNYQDAPGLRAHLARLEDPESECDAVLVDSSTARAVGGTGTRFDWQGARESFQRFAPQLRLIAAGGLAPDNVQQAIEILRPWGVDVVSGVEGLPSRKDPGRVLAFIQAARQAETAMTHAVEQ